MIKPPETLQGFRQKQGRHVIFSLCATAFCSLSAPKRLRRCFPLTQAFPDPPDPGASREEIFLQVIDGLQEDSTVPQRFPDVAESLVPWLNTWNSCCILLVETEECDHVL